MTKRMQSLLALGAMLPLLGQGCVGVNQQTQVKPAMEAELQSPDAAIDAAVNAELEAALNIESAERAGDADAELIANDEAALNSYTEAQYELQ